MVVASLIISLVGVIAAGIGTFMAFRGNPRDYTTLRRLGGARVEPPDEQEVAFAISSWISEPPRPGCWPARPFSSFRCC